MIDYSLILITNFANKQWIFSGTNYEGLEWHDESPKPTKQELDALWETAKIIDSNNQAKEKRRKDYIAEADPLFFKAQRGEITIEEWQNKVAEIKLRYPNI
jgi:hypothetical protein